MKGVLARAVFIICITLPFSLLVRVEDKLYVEENQMFYIEPQQKFNWSESDANCKNRSMSLVTLDTKEKVQRLHKVLQDIFLVFREPIPRLYIGANDLVENGNFIWTKTNDSFSYTHWESTEPNNYKGQNERCVHLGFHGDDEWNDINCSRKYGYICEQPKTDYEFAKLSRGMDFA